jgi:chemotaxis protein MotB
VSRRRRHEEHENHERWLVSYADFITLLFAFFVVMYAVSSVNEGKYRVLSDSLLAAFRGPSRSIEPIQVGQLVRAPPVQIQLPVSAPHPIALMVPIQRPDERLTEQGPNEGGAAGEHASRGDGEQPDLGDGQDPGARPAGQEEVARRIEAALADLIDRELIEVRRVEDRVEVEIRTSILFPSGSARLVEGAMSVLQDVSEILKGFPNPVRVEGFTDNVPISTEVYPSNWELSAGRAATVVQVCARHGVRPERLVAVGYGEYRPVADNATAEGRSRNRRVVIVIPTAVDPRREVDPGQPIAADSGLAPGGGPGAGPAAGGLPPAPAVDTQG